MQFPIYIPTQRSWSRRSSLWKCTKWVSSFFTLFLNFISFLVRFLIFFFFWGQILWRWRMLLSKWVLWDNSRLLRWSFLCKCSTWVRNLIFTSPIISFFFLDFVVLVSAVVHMGIVGLVQIIVLVLLVQMLQMGKYIFFTKLEVYFFLVFVISENVVQLMATVAPVQTIVSPIIVEMEILEIADALTASKIL